MSLNTGRASGVSADNAHGVIRPGPQRMQASPGPPQILGGTGHRAEVQLADSACTSPNIACRRSRQASHRVRSSSRRMPARISMPRSRSARRRACSSSLARPARALAPTVEALPLMVCRVAALPGHRPRRAGVRAGRRGPCPEPKRRNTGRSARATAETPDDIAPRLDQFARVRCRCRAPGAALPR